MCVVCVCVVFCVCNVRSVVCVRVECVERFLTCARLHVSYCQEPLLRFQLLTIEHNTRQMIAKTVMRTRSHPFSKHCLVNNLLDGHLLSKCIINALGGGKPNFLLSLGEY